MRCRYRVHLRAFWLDHVRARHKSPKIPPPQPIPTIELPAAPDITIPGFGFSAPPAFDPEAVERKKEAKRQEELRSIIARRGRGREGTIKNVGGAAGLDEESAEIQRQALIRRK